MLVLGRRLNEKVVFPDFGATVQVVAVQGSVVRLGVEAPAQVVVLREELCRAPGAGSGACPPAPPAHDARLERVKHILRNRLNNVGLGLALLQRHLHPYLTGTARATLEHLSEEFQVVLEQLQAITGAEDSCPGLLPATPQQQP